MSPFNLPSKLPLKCPYAWFRPNKGTCIRINLSITIWQTCVPEFFAWEKIKLNHAVDHLLLISLHIFFIAVYSNVKLSLETIKNCEHGSYQQSKLKYETN